MDVSLKKIIAPSFFHVHNLVKKQKYSEFWLKGGRGSTKSTFPSIEIVLGMMKDPEANAVLFRQVKDTLKDSVYAQILWAIDKLGVSAYWKATESPMRITYVPTGQKIIFRGLDKADKTKSIKTRHGYFKYIWFEELHEFRGMDEIRKALQSVQRGKGSTITFYTYNPPRAMSNWVNVEATKPVPFRYTHHSTYLTVPREWLGPDFIQLAEHIKTASPDIYRHEYLGEVIGTGGTVFKNLTIRPISDEEISQFDRVGAGIDWGYAADPFAYVKSHFDATRRRLYIFAEIYGSGMSNRIASSKVHALPNPCLITCDSAEPKSIAEFRELRHRVAPARKGPDSVEYGIKFQEDLEEIIIDPLRCPNTAREYQNYELEPDNNGGFKPGYPDKNNHTIDATRYRLEAYTLRKKPGKATIS